MESAVENDVTKIQFENAVEENWDLRGKIQFDTSRRVANQTLHLIFFAKQLDTK